MVSGWPTGINREAANMDIVSQSRRTFKEVIQAWMF